MEDIAERFFQPSLVIFVDEVGQQVYQQFSSILRLVGLAEPLQSCIGLINYTHTLAGTPMIIPRLASELVATRRQTTKNAQGNTATSSNVTIAMPREYTLKDILENMLWSLSLKSKSDEIKHAGYSITKPDFQIYIIASAGSALINGVLRTVRKWLSLGDWAVASDVYLLLRSNASIARNDIPGITYTLQNAGPLVKFFYMFEDMPAVSEEDSCYVIAQALYALVATGITSQNTFEQHVGRQPLSRRRTRVGYLITSCILFPQRILRDYCSAYLGNELMQQWSDDVNTGVIHEEERAGLELRAHQLMEEIEQWMRENLPHPEKLFKLFSPKSVDEEYKNRQEPADTWVDIVEKVIVEKAEEQYGEWKQKMADPWWQGLKRGVQTYIEETVDDILSSGINSSHMVKAYIAECKKTLTLLSSNLSEQYKNNYQAERKKLEGVLSTSSKTFHRQLPTTGNPFQTEMGHLVRALQQRFASEYAHVASPLTLATAGVLTLPPFVLLALTLFPGWSTPLVIGMGVSFLSLLSILLYRQQRRELLKMRQALLTLGNLYFQYAYDCKDELQRKITAALHDMFDRIMQKEEERLQKTRTVTTQVGAVLQARVDGVSEELKKLFNSPQATRNTFIGADGSGQMNLAYVQTLALSIAKRYGGETNQNYDRSQFLKSFSQELNRVIRDGEHEPQQEMDKDNAVQYILNIVRNIIDPYLDGCSLAKTNELKVQTWEDAFSLVHSPLSHSALGSPNPLFICGGNRDLLDSGEKYVRNYMRQNNMQKEPVIVHTDNPEWLLLAGFFHAKSTVGRAITSHEI